MEVVLVMFDFDTDKYINSTPASQDSKKWGKKSSSNNLPNYKDYVFSKDHFCKIVKLYNQ
jgi:hypothetical protein